MDSINPFSTDGFFQLLIENSLYIPLYIFWGLQVGFFCLWTLCVIIRKQIFMPNSGSKYLCLIQDIEADFLWKVSLKILNLRIMLKTSTHDDV